MTITSEICKGVSLRWNCRREERGRERTASFLYSDATHRSATLTHAYTHRKRRTRSSIQGDSERREVGAPTLRKRRIKPDVSADLRAVSNRMYRLHQTAHYSSLLLLRGVAAENLPRSAADAVRNYFFFLLSVFYNTAQQNNTVVLLLSELSKCWN